ncbi:MAG TPA: leucyl/phenylalanyl-tRNA--protein transferase [Saprospiraceae bacterium]|nr:leucyl/phenylalanyl-tRNA--protein transferase [Saprospiraceae bacterium]HMP23861.1 leucyl/phenylalanyl-tRNA--protein transferase [Saprospiraceae bacterium]
MPVFRLPDDELVFPHPELADPNGMLAVGGDLSADRLLLAYEWGIFPWFNPGEPILWWSPDPRFVLFPDELKIAKSMRPYFNQRKFTVSFDERFESVVRACQQQQRNGQGGGTWITEDMVEAYYRLYESGYAHSVEVWQGKALVGGLYGVALGKIFFGESMFAAVSNASKFGFITLVQYLQKVGFRLVDCQQQTRHLGSLGARAIDRQLFLDYLTQNREETTHVGHWTLPTAH